MNDKISKDEAKRQLSEVPGRLWQAMKNMMHAITDVPINLLRLAGVQDKELSQIGGKGITYLIALAIILLIVATCSRQAEAAELELYLDLGAGWDIAGNQICNDSEYDQERVGCDTPYGRAMVGGQLNFEVTPSVVVSPYVEASHRSSIPDGCCSLTDGDRGGEEVWIGLRVAKVIPL